MDNNENNLQPKEEEIESPSSAIDEKDAKIEALNQLYNEQKEINAQILNELKQLKISNEKMVLKLGVDKEKTDADLFAGFSKYK